MPLSTYVLVTAAKNEDAHIERLINAVVSQTILPLRWVIISDGSTDRTDEIVQSHMIENDFIKLLRSEGDDKRNFGSKALAISFGVNQMSDLNYEYIGILDADVSFSPTYYETLLERMNSDSRLGITGGTRQELVNNKFKEMTTPANSVGGPIQFFNRKCFEEVGGYLPLKFGGIDAVAEISARMKGWKVKSYSDLCFYHFRSTGSADRNYIQARFRSGRKNYLIGYHPVFLALMLVKKIRSRAIFIFGGPFELVGYIWEALRCGQRPVADEFVIYLRSEQVHRIKSLLLTGQDPANE